MCPAIRKLTLDQVSLLAGASRLGYVHLKQPRSFTGVRAQSIPSLDGCDGSLKNEAGIVLPATKDFAEEAIQSIKLGKVIAVPTDTLYGFACDAWYAFEPLY